MKRIILTESQYKRLVRQNLNEQRVVYEDPKDEKDINYDMFSILDSVAYDLDSAFNKKLYVKRIEDGKVYIDKTKYTQEEIDYIRKKFKILVNMDLSNVDKMFTNDSDLGFDSGVDSDYDWGDEDITVIDDEGTAEVEDDESTAEVEDDESTAEIDNVDLNYDPNKTYSRAEYINLIKDIAINQMKKHKIPASITIAQAALESGNGNSGLSREGLAHFGIKCGSAWAGKTYYADATEENEDGTMRIERGTCWRAYDSIGYSFEDHSKLLKNSRYSSLFDLDITDYKGWANGLKNAGYATDSQYPNKLINIIEKNNLQQYDNGENIIDCENCLTKIQTKSYDENVNDENVKDFRWWINQDSNRLKSVTDKLKECCETKNDPTISTSYNKKNENTLIAFSVVGNEWINSGKPSKPKDVIEYKVELDDSRLYTPKSTGNYFRKGNDELYGKKGHSGHDYVAVNNPIVYMKDGLVKSALFNNDDCGGTITIVPKGEDRRAIFCHMSKIYVTKGEEIEAGTVIGVTGGGAGQKGKGHSTGHHLHFGMKDKSSGGKFINPNDYIDDFKLIK